MLKTNELTGSYTTVWRQFEELAIRALQEVLPRRVSGLDMGDLDTGQSGSEKNRLADVAIVCDTNLIEVSVKSARAATNPENDLGTFRDHPRRKEMFAASFTLWIRYDISEEEKICCDRVFFDRTWRFVGKSSLVDGVKYRKKDGNMRPKPWSMFENRSSYWASEQEFEAAVKRSEAYRANELIKQYLADLNEDDQRLLFDTLKARYENPSKKDAD